MMLFEEASVNATFDASHFRHALGRFATGVTIVTTTTPDGTPIGLTANSFNSVSLSPPLVLWSINKRSRSLEVFETSGRFAINVLCADQMPLAARFASPVPDRFEGVPWRSGRGGMPLFDGCVAWFECNLTFKYEGGDHFIFVGEVVDLHHCDRVPLLYAAGAYGVPTPHPDLAIG
ncbi:nitrilotriacetate monooxygenase [Pandoraea pnomenusa]|uniref:Nitrilotriacetate monooxygenase n=1 Tax=Pandoraea pnomenusa TaxID=93220 RepID=A0ABY6WIU6_9BURK|nr:flavin reductase family protein [Pandoraea pnomenusa]VVE65883.1 nitrilotriacetate monooxygenase [Pandoraea pnomenusa]